MERRDFLKTTALGVAAAAMGEAAVAQPTPPAAGLPMPDTVEAGGMRYRTLGRTGQRVSLVGLGGFHLAKPGPQKPSEADAVRIVHAAMDNGVTFFDNCWDYNDGVSEERLGLALSDGGRRDRAFLMTKLDGRTAEAATAQLDTSLRRLRTDHLDLVQFHEIIRMDDPERVFAAGGALEAMLRAKAQGKVRHIGFTGHKNPAIHRHMFEVAEAHGFTFDTVQMPVNVMDAQYDSFQATIFPIAARHDTAVLAMKTFGDPFIFDARVAEPEELLHYSMSQPVAVVVCGCDQMAYLDQALRAVRSWTPMAAEQQRALLARAAPAARDGGTERYKVSTHFDGTTQHPQWLTQA